MTSVQNSKIYNKIKRKLFSGKLITFIYIVIFFLSTFINIFGASNRGFFNEFQNDSESIILKSMQMNTLGAKYGLYLEEERPYESQIGLLGYVYSFVKLILTDHNINSVFFYNLILGFNSLASAFVIGLIVQQINLKYSKLYGFLVIMCFTFSPWVVAAANNLYIAFWLWFLPSLALIYGKNLKKKLFIFYLFSVIKFATGFEQTTVYLIVPLVIYFLCTFKNQKINVKDYFSILITEILAFLTTFLFLANKRGNGDLLRGVLDLIQTTIARRTYGNSNCCGDAYKDSLEVNPLEVIKIYFIEWDTNVLQIYFGYISVEYKYFILFNILTFLSLIYLWSRSNFKLKEFSIIYILSFAIPISWYLLGKAHSYIHTHILFLLWYIFYLPTIIYIPLKTLQIIITKKKHV